MDIEPGEAKLVPPIWLPSALARAGSLDITSPTAHGFEGRGVAWEGAQPHDQPVFHGPYLSELQLDGNPAAATPACVPKVDDHLFVPSGNGLLDLGLEVLPGPRPASPELSDAVVATIDARFRHEAR